MPENPYDPMKDPEKYAEWLYDQQNKAKYEGRYQIGPDQQQNFFDQLIKMLNTGARAQVNANKEFAAANKLSAGASGALNRNTNYNSLLAQTQGVNELQRYFSDVNIRGKMAEDNMMLNEKQLMVQRDLAQNQQDDQFWNSLVLMLGEAAGGYAQGLAMK